MATLLLLLALALRVAYVLHTSHFVLRVDAKSYDALGRGLAGGHGWVFGPSAYRPPGYPLFLAWIYLILGIPNGSWTDPRLVEALLSTVTVGLIGLMALQVAGRAAMLITLTIAAVYVPLLLIGVSLMSESLFVPLVLAAINCALRSRATAKRNRWIIAAGLLTGLAALTRGNGIVLGLALALVVWTGKPRLSSRAISSPAILLAVMALTIMPWTIRNAITEHTFVPVTTELGTTLAGTYNALAAHHHFMWMIGGYRNYAAIRNNGRINDATRNSRLTSAVLSYVGQHPSYVPQAMFWNTMRLLDLQGRLVSRKTARNDADATAAFADLGVYNFWVVGLLALGGALTVAARRVPRALWAVPLLLWASEAPITTGTPRFRAVLDPFVILLAAFAIQALATALLRRREALLPRRELDMAPTAG